MQRRTSWLGSRVRLRVMRSARGTSGLRREQWWVTPTRGDPQESATENKPPRCPFSDFSIQLSAFGVVRVKRRGKSSPRCWRQGRHGKPRWEQDQVAHDEASR